MPRKLILILVVVLIIGAFAGWFIWQKNIKNPNVLSASQTPDYTYVFVGDSMTETLGNFDELRADLKEYYPNKNFLLLNYGFGSTNVLSLTDRIEKDSTHSGRIFKPINDIPYDAIFIESMGNNPLSQFPVDQGLQKQNEALDQIVSSLQQKHPKSPIIFIATIAPNKEHYAEGTTTLQPDQKLQWVNERIAYMQNHMKYARDHNIPLIDIFDQSIDKNGDGNIDLINNTDHIHPSPTGVFFISQQTADFIAKQKLVH